MGSQKRWQAFRILLRSILFATILILFTFQGSKAETYYNHDSKYPDVFCNNIFDTENNDMENMDAVEFGGKSIVFFTLFSSCSESYEKYLFYYYDSDHAHKLDIGNSQARNYQIKTVVFKNVLYVFYTNANWNVIRYRTATVNTGSDGTGWALEWSGEKSISAGPTTTLRFGAWMNDTLYFIYSDGYNWYYISSADGLAFNSPIYFFHGGPIYGAGGAVFQVPDETEGFVEKLMISYATKSALKYFFFDGTSSYGAHDVSVLTNTSPYSVRLAAGSAEDYSSTQYAIQVFYSAPCSDTSQTWSNIYHREYFPAGANGDEGVWSTEWTHLGDPEDSTIKTSAYLSDPHWAIVTQFYDEAPNARMWIYLWYARGSHYTFSADQVLFKRSGYKSNLLVHANNTIVPPGEDISASTVLGVIEGTPPFPENGGMPVGDSQFAVSNLSLISTTSLETRTAWSVGGSILATFGHKFPDPLGFSVTGKLSGALKYTQETKNSNTSTTSLGFSSWGDATPGDLGWVLVLQPQIINDEYILKSWDENCLAYGTNICPDGTDEFGVSAITYGDGSILKAYPYKLVDPSDPFNQGDPPTIFTGMAERAVSTDLEFWATAIDTLNPSYQQSGYPLPSVWSSTGIINATTVTAGTTQAETWSPSANFSVQAQILGFIDVGPEVSANFSMDIQTTTTMTNSLTFTYHLPWCTDDQTGYCYSTVTVQPSLLIANDDASGYNAYWISDDIRDNKKPKPWCLTYVATPSVGSSETLGTSGLAVKQAQGALFFDRGAWDRDQITAHFTLEGIRPDFSLGGDELVRLWIGNHQISTDKDNVIDRYFQGKHLIIELSEVENPDSFIRIRLSYDKRQSQLDIRLDADGIDLSKLSAYRFLSGEETSRRTAGTVPFILHLGGQHYAVTELDVGCTFNSQNGKCTFRGEN